MSKTTRPKINECVLEAEKSNEISKLDLLDGLAQIYEAGHGSRPAGLSPKEIIKELVEYVSACGDQRLKLGNLLIACEKELSSTTQELALYRYKVHAAFMLETDMEADKKEVLAVLEDLV